MAMSRAQRMRMQMRGLRTPLMTDLRAIPPHQLHPFLVHPLRPMETLVGMSINGHALLSNMVKLAWTPPIEFEVGVWKVPVASLGDEFQQLLISDPEDEWDLGSDVDRVGTGVRYPPGSVTEQGHLDGSALGDRDRPWAGEIGTPDLEGVSNPARAYAKFTSASTYRVANSFYETEYDEANRSQIDDDLYQVPPQLSEHIRGATFSGISAGEASPVTPDSDNIPVDSVSTFAERLSMMGNANLTWAEWLRAWGSDISRISSIPEPVFVKRYMMTNFGSPQYGPALTDLANVLTPSQVLNGGETVTEFQQTPGRIFSDSSGLAQFGQVVRARRRRRVIADEPSILLGTICWWPWMNELNELVAHFDANRMIFGSMWGHPMGGLDEAEFVTVQDVSGATPGLGHDGASLSNRAFNLLNLYLNGEATSNEPGRFGFRFFGQQVSPFFEAIGGTEDDQQLVNSMLKTRLAIATDLVR